MDETLQPIIPPFYFNFVYCTINKKNGKCYIGSHRTLNKNDRYLGSGRYFYKSLIKNGRKNFIRFIIREFDDIIEARKKEEYYIELFNTLIPNGYNLSPKGGLRIKGCHSLESIEKIRKGNLGKKRIYTKDGKRRLKESAKQKKETSWNKGLTKETDKRVPGGWNKGIPWSQTTKDKMSKARIELIKNNYGR